MSNEILVMWDKEILVPSVEEAMEFVSSRLIGPCTFDHELARSRGLIGEGNTLTNEYLKAQAIYRAAFYQYLNNKVNISQYEKMLDETGYNFIQRDISRQHLYQRFGSFGNRFIFLRNNFYIERLHQDDVNILIEASDEDALVDLAARTYRDVIRINPRENTDKNTYTYDAGVLSGYREVPNAALLLYIAFASEFNEAGDFVSRENEKIKVEIAQKLAIQMQEELTAVLGHPAVVHLYNW